MESVQTLWEVVDTTGNSFFGIFFVEEWVIDRNFIVELFVLLMICLYGLSWVLKFNAFVPRAAWAWSWDFIFFDCIEYFVRFVASLGLFAYGILISQNPYTCSFLILEILLIMGRFIYLICKKKREYSRLRAKFLEMKANKNNPLFYQK